MAIIVAGDVGGTKTLLRATEGDANVLREQRYENGSFATFDAILGDFLAGLTVDAACFAVAGPVHDGGAEVTNVGWRIEEAALSRVFSIPRVRLINDFHATALGIARLGEGDLVSLQAGTRDRTAPIAVLGAGTGLGQTMIVGGQPLSTEGGHGDFAPQDEEQTRLFLRLHERYGHVSWERVLSGMGLSNIYAFLGGPEGEEPAKIAGLADAGDARAHRTFEIFVDVYGAEAGNMALRVLARGGVYLAGGIAAKNIARFTDGRFLEAFRRKGRFRDLMTTIPVDLIVNEEVGLMGAEAGAG